MVQSSWQDRHQQIDTILDEAAVKQALCAFCVARKTVTDQSSTIQHDEGHAENNELTPTEATSSTFLGKRNRAIDLAVALVWSSQHIKPHRDANLCRRNAMPLLKRLPRTMINENDFSPLNNLQRGGTGMVDVVRCKNDRRLYVLKSILKGAARREPYRMVPMTEKMLLLKATTEAQGQDSEEPLVGHEKHCYTPRLLAAFQSSGSLHLVLEYFPAGDLEALLEAAGQADASYPGKSKKGGLLLESWVKGYAIDVVAAVAWLHEQGFAHRDIKPSNFLLHRSGHLKLCDFGTAAPFSQFDSAMCPPLPSSAASGVSAGSSAAESSSSPAKTRRVHQFYCQKPAGTCDYIAPEILLYEEAKLARAAILRRFSSSSCSTTSAISSCPASPDQSGYSSVSSASAADTTTTSTSYSDSRHDVSSMSKSAAHVQLEQEAPGAYGPEVDWWSVGVMLYEMTYGKLPFWAVSPEEAWYKIRNHETYFQLNSSVTVSSQLKSLLRKLLSKAENRLGKHGSHEIKAHALFGDVDWDHHWDIEPPFIPSVGGKQGNTAGMTASPVAGVRDLLDFEEPSVLHSPMNTAGDSTSMFSSFDQSSGLSGFLNANQHVPLFMDSFDQAEAAVAATRQQHAPPERTSMLGELIGADDWEDVDCDWVGFSHRPRPTAFSSSTGKGLRTTSAPSVVTTAASHVPLIPERKEAELAEAAGQVANEQLRQHGMLDSPAGPMPAQPFVSTPYVPRISEMAARTELALLADASPQGHTVEALSRMRVSSSPNLVTPARKISLSNFSSVINGVGEGAKAPQSAVPASPYPFPVASSVRKPFMQQPHRSGWSATAALRRNDLDRARSATPGGHSMGSDTRCSGGSTAKREVSESQAFYVMMSAVAKSAKKAQQGKMWRPKTQAPGAHDEEEDEEDFSTPEKFRHKSPFFVVGPRPAPRVEQPQQSPRTGFSVPHDHAKVPTSSGGPDSLAQKDWPSAVQRVGGIPKSDSNSSIASTQSNYGGNFVTRLNDPMWSAPGIELTSIQNVQENPQTAANNAALFEDGDDDEDFDGALLHDLAGGGDDAGELRHAKSRRQMRLKALQRDTPSRTSTLKSPALLDLSLTALHGSASASMSEDTPASRGGDVPSTAGHIDAEAGARRASTHEDALALLSSSPTAAVRRRESSQGSMCSGGGGAEAGTGAGSGLGSGLSAGAGGSLNRSTSPAYISLLESYRRGASDGLGVGITLNPARGGDENRFARRASVGDFSLLMRQRSFSLASNSGASAHDEPAVTGGAGERLGVLPTLAPSGSARLHESSRPMHRKNSEEVLSDFRKGTHRPPRKAFGKAVSMPPPARSTTMGMVIGFVTAADTTFDVIREDTSQAFVSLDSRLDGDVSTDGDAFGSCAQVPPASPLLQRRSVRMRSSISKGSASTASGGLKSKASGSSTTAAATPVAATTTTKWRQDHSSHAGLTLFQDAPRSPSKQPTRARCDASTPGSGSASDGTSSPMTRLLRRRSKEHALFHTHVLGGIENRLQSVQMSLQALGEFGAAPVVGESKESSRAQAKPAGTNVVASPPRRKKLLPEERAKEEMPTAATGVTPRRKLR
ncbi:hypothetical protein K437DRAFT_18383 [Tilletiaria anomala UBC 951]|uniref:Protein kinase domain-containing protein n=1 Tax=Tilletiaria anomala (strain ATCC 24038 / CBS 436.72 / UBC 951) TaxID=1037660 RepID=A0A066WEP3_TILAU|nr:uncharacterized protein K437DRAFT_18383 [Tilletiaria anomala UBC 951]KDN52392.1 hypothetical protein K437DRAFT_18383 [Tilletiaria anomala UBC 951]